MQFSHRIAQNNQKLTHSYQDRQQRVRPTVPYIKLSEDLIDDFSSRPNGYCTREQKLNYPITLREHLLIDGLFTFVDQIQEFIVEMKMSMKTHVLEKL